MIARLLRRRRLRRYRARVVMQVVVEYDDLHFYSRAEGAAIVRAWSPASVLGDADHCRAQIRSVQLEEVKREPG